MISFAKFFPCVFSDHDYIDLVLELDGFSTRRSPVWKFNSSLLSDAEFKQLIVNEIEKHKLKVNNFDSLGDWWDDLKIRFRKLSIDFAAHKQRKSNFVRASLNKRLIRAKNALHAGDQRAAPIVRNLESDFQKSGRR